MRGIVQLSSRRIGRLLLIVLVWACVGCRDEAPASSFEEYIEEQITGRISVEHLKTLSNGDSTPIVEDIFIEGYVVANDLYGEYYKSIVVCDESGGIEISIDCSNLAAVFPVASRVIVHCSSLALGNYGGYLTLGAQPEGEYSVGRIAERDIARYFVIDKTSPMVITPLTITIDELTPALIGDYVLLNDVTFGSQAGRPWCEVDAATGDILTTSRVLYDRNGGQMGLTVISRCTYAQEYIPSGYGRVCGVVEYFNGEYSLKIVNRMMGF